MRNTFVRFGLALCGMLLVVNARADINTTCSATLSSPKAAQISKSTTNASTAILIDVLSATPVNIGGWGLGYGPVPKGVLSSVALTTCTKNGVAITAATTAVIGDVISCPITAVGGTGIEAALFETLAGVTSGAGIIDIHQFVTACTAGKGTYWKPPTTGACAASLQASACITQPLLPPVLGMAAGSTSAIVGSNVTFTLTVSNANTVNALSNVVVSDVIPAGLSYISNAPTLGSATVAGQTLTWLIPSLPAGGSATLTLVVQPTAKGSYTNTATSSGATPASATILILPNAITRYSMDEAVGAWTGAAGEVIDSGGNALNGHRRTVTAPTTTNTFAPGPAPAPAPTIASLYPAVKNGFCNAGKFDGNAVVESASSTFFQFTNTLSASAWIYPTAYPAAGGLYSILSNDTNYEFHLDSAGHLYWWWGSSTLTSVGTIPLNTWTHIAITMNSSLGAASRQRIYINGVADTATNNWSGTLTSNACPFYIGGDISTNSGCALMPARNFRGMIDEAKIYDYELTAAEVQADMTLGRMCTSSGTFDHIRIEHDGSASTCAPKTVTLKACMDAACTSLYTGSITLTLSPPGWTPTDTVTFSGGVTTATLSQASIAAPSITLNATGISPAPAGITRCFNGATETCTLGVDAATSCNFDAAEVGAVYPQTHLYTKLAGVPFDINIVALAGTAPNLSVNTGYKNTVSVDLVDTSVVPCSSTSPALSPAQNVRFRAADLGYKLATITCATPASSVQVRITRGGATACSTDKFAVRPSAVTLSSNNALATPPSSTDARTIAAGAPFNINATTAPTSYTGTLALDVTKLEAQLPTNVAGVVPGGIVGALETSALPKSPLALLANAVPTNNASYSEVGYLYVNPGAFSDAVFTSVDQVGQVANCATTNPESCDCLLSSKMTNAGVPDNLSDVLINGRYGCYVGNKARFDLGRFIPDHFNTMVYQVSKVPMDCPTGLACPTAYNGFVYSGQAFPVQVTAASQAGGATRNYTGNFAKSVTLGAWSVLGGGTQNPSGALANGSVLAASFSAGVASTTVPAYTLATATTAPVNIYIRAADADGVTSLRAANSVEGGVAVASGRIKLSNAYGSELLPLTLTAQAQYYSANGWVASLTDSVTKLALAYGGTLTTGATITPATKVLNGGSLSIKLAAPNAAGTVIVTPSIDAASPGNPPLTLNSGTATFGIYKSNSTFIYRRER